MNRMEQEHTVDVAFVLVLFCTFAISVLFVLLFGAGSYQTVAERMEAHYEERTGLAYIATKVRHFDNNGDVMTAEQGGISTLLLREKVGEQTYVTSIYYYDGALRELYAEEGTRITPDVGAVIIPAKSFDVEPVTGSLLRLRCTGESGREKEIYLHVRSESGVMP